MFQYYIYTQPTKIVAFGQAELTVRKYRKPKGQNGAIVVEGPRKKAMTGRSRQMSFLPNLTKGIERIKIKRYEHS